MTTENTVTVTTQKTVDETLELLLDLIHKQADILVSMQQHQELVRYQLNIIMKSSETVSQLFNQYKEGLSDLSESLKPDIRPTQGGTG